MTDDSRARLTAARDLIDHALDGRIEHELAAEGATQLLARVLANDVHAE